MNETHMQEEAVVYENDLCEQIKLQLLLLGF